MNDKLAQLIMRHIDLIDGANRLTNSILNAAKKGDVDTLVNDSDNRDRLISVLDRFQKFVEEEIGNIKSNEVSKELVDILKTWSYEVSAWASKTDEIDQQTLQLLEAQKEETTKEIATIFKSRQQFSGYNLNNLKK
ncbi:hypothetical protein M899_0105 [Bacteriovorax sp. BSW11_IV]|uniref:hypothetical protein n=1 Tax=Bacteriovorax sp. BSW11_IV TaxID=1353529 RepID=UPI00038A4294|nr:hypothetical protein [Bacteriovorax sp. BSW11_IV]EQC44857.1 hypothetical protein M899_0105 [Bacteriovorax sp. BSW11_IV]